MSSNHLIQQRARPYTEPLLENSSLRDNLTDEQAAALLAWGTAVINEKAVLTTQFPDKEANRIMEQTSTDVRLIMQGMKDLVGDVGRPLAFDVIDDTMMRLLKNLRWLTDRRLTSGQQAQREAYNQARDEGDADAAFAALLALISFEDSPSV
jgi:hypothetical protein